MQRSRQEMGGVPRTAKVGPQRGGQTQGRGQANEEQNHQDVAMETAQRRWGCALGNSTLSKMTASRRGQRGGKR